MIYFFQALSLKVRFLVILLLGFPVLGLQWLLTGAPWALARLQFLSGGAGLPDMGFWYAPAALQAQFAAWGPLGREVYLTVLWPTDTGFLLAYGTLLTAATLYLLKKANPARPWWYLLPLVPLAGAAADFLENAAVALASVLPAEGWEPVAWFAAGATAVKWSALGLAAAVLVVGTLAHLGRRAWGKFRASLPPDPLADAERPDDLGRN